MNRAIACALVAGWLFVLPAFGQQGTIARDPDGADPEPAEAAVLATLFPPQLEWRPVAGNTTALATRFGTLTVAQGERCPGTGEPIFFVEIRLDGERIDALGCTPEGDYYLVFFKNAFVLGATDVVVLGAGAGGSGSPPERLHLIVLDRNRTLRIEQDPTFRSVDGTARVAVDGTRLWFDLGYAGHARRTAAFDGATLSVVHRSIAPAPVAARRCESGYRALSDCMQRGRSRGLAGYSFAQFLYASSTLSTASRGSLRALGHHPGFSGDAFMEACRVAAERGELPDYASFAAGVCTP